MVGGDLMIDKIYETLVCIEGLNGSGKATQTKLLLGYLDKKYNKTKTIEFPIYDSPSGKLLTDYLHSGINKDNTYYNALLYELNRFEIYLKMKSWLEDGYWVVLDRYFYSNWTFQKVLANDDTFLDWVKNIEVPLPKPKYNIFLDVPIDVTIGLMKDKKKDWHEEDEEFMRTVYIEYKQIAKDHSWIVVQCMEGGKLLAPREIHKKLVKELGL